MMHFFDMFLICFTPCRQNQTKNFQKYFTISLRASLISLTSSNAKESQNQSVTKTYSVMTLDCRAKNELKKSSHLGDILC